MANLDANSGRQMIKRWKYLLFLAVSVFLTLFFLIGLIGFLRGDTAYFAGMGLSDPAKGDSRAGLHFGALITAVMTLSLAFATVRFWELALAQVGPYEQAQRVWARFSSSQEPIVPGDERATQLLQELAEIKHGRIGRAIQSWNDPSPYSNAEALIDADASKGSEHISFLQAVAAIVVLLGLVGNFWGLSEAVKTLPNLADFGASGTMTRQVQQQEGDDQSLIVKETITGGSISSGEEARKAVEKIAQGLSVVVVSSVCGIGGMAVMLLYISFFRSLLERLVNEEIILVAEEIGSAIRPMHGDSRVAEEVRSLGRSLATGQEHSVEILTEIRNSLGALPTALSPFLEGARLLQGRNQELATVVSQLDSVLRHQLESAGQSYQDFAQVLRALHSHLQGSDQILSVVQTQSTDMVREASDVARRLHEIGQSVSSIAASQQSIQSKYENYARLVNSILTEDRESAASRFETLVERLSQVSAEQLKALANDLLQGQTQSRQDIGQLLRDSQNLWQVESANLRDLLSSSLRTLHDEFDGSRKEHTERLQDLLSSQQSLQEGMQATVSEMAVQNEQVASQGVQQLNALKDALGQAADVIRDRIRELSDELHGSQQSMIERLESTAASLAQQSESLTRERETREASFKLALEDSLTAIGARFESLAQDLRTAQAARDLEQRDVMSELKSGLLSAARDLTSGSQSIEEATKGHQRLLKEALEELRALSNQAVQALEEPARQGQQVLQEAQRRFLEVQDRWAELTRIRQEDLFAEWSRQFAAVTLEPLVGRLEAVSENLARLADEHRRVDLGRFVEAADAIKQSLEHREPRLEPEYAQRLDEGIRLLESLSNRLTAQEQLWRCPQCQTSNQADREYCNRCGKGREAKAATPDLDLSKVEQHLASLSERLSSAGVQQAVEGLKEAVDSYASRAVVVPDLQRVLDGLFGLQQQMAFLAARAPEPDQIRQAIEALEELRAISQKRGRWPW